MVILRDWSVCNINDLANVYNLQIADCVPHCYEVSEDEFVAGCYRKTGDDFQSSFQDERVIVGIRDNKILGFAHLRIGEIEHRDHHLVGGFVHFLTYAVGYRAVGQAILTECERHCREMGVTTIRIFDGYFYRFHHLGFPLVSDHMAHIYGLLGKNDYRLSGEGEIFLEYKQYQVDEPVLPEATVEVQLRKKQGRGDLPNLTTRILQDSIEIGSCVALSGGDFCKIQAAEECVFIDGLGVKGKDQGKGWGRYLLARTLWESRKFGYKHSVISTAKYNYRAQLFYTNFGYRVTDTVYGFIKNSE